MAKLFNPEDTYRAWTISDAIDENLQRLTAKLSSRQLRVEIDMDGDTAGNQVCERRVLDAIANLLDQAIERSPIKGTVSIYVGQTNRGSEIEIADEGSDPEETNQALSAFSVQELSDLDGVAHVSKARLPQGGMAFTLILQQRMSRAVAA